MADDLQGAADAMLAKCAATPARRGSSVRRRLWQKPSDAPVEFYSATAAQATEILLGAIARSNGTRASVTREVFKTKVRNGILGSFSFDRNGDATAGSVTIYRVVDGKPKLVGLVTPSPALVR